MSATWSFVETNGVQISPLSSFSLINIYLMQHAWFYHVALGYVQCWLLIYCHRTTVLNLLILFSYQELFSTKVIHIFQLSFTWILTPHLTLPLNFAFYSSKSLDCHFGMYNSLKLVYCQLMVWRSLHQYKLLESCLLLSWTRFLFQDYVLITASW